MLNRTFSFFRSRKKEAIGEWRRYGQKHFLAHLVPGFYHVVIAVAIL